MPDTAQRVLTARGPSFGAPTGPRSDAVSSTAGRQSIDPSAGPALSVPVRPSTARVYDADRRYDGISPFPALPSASEGSSGAWRLQVAMTVLLVVGPLAAVVVAVIAL